MSDELLDTVKSLASNSDRGNNNNTDDVPKIGGKMVNEGTVPDIGGIIELSEKAPIPKIRDED